MSDTTVPLRLSSGVTVTAWPTVTAGLIVYALTEGDNGLRLAHHTGVYLAEFSHDDDAQAAASALGRLADWSQDAESLQRKSLISAMIDIVEAHGGQCRFRQGGLGEQVSAERREKKGAHPGGA
ncbi:hypothetical protein [Streptomyces mirabilis]|uniref:hypothetical protein n=1 Tax=Streptomyces mirabilis TaxID=68239 RepID=UPI0033FD9027